MPKSINRSPPPRKHFSGLQTTTERDHWGHIFLLPCLSVQLLPRLQLAGGHFFGRQRSTTADHRHYINCIRSCSKGQAGFHVLEFPKFQFPVLMEWLKPDLVWREKQLMNSNNQGWVTGAAEHPKHWCCRATELKKAFLTFRVMATT